MNRSRSRGPRAAGDRPPARRSRKDVELDDGLDAPVEPPFACPQNPDELAAFVRDVLGARVASRALIDGNDGPLAYLVHAFFEGRFALKPDGAWVDYGRQGPRPPGDCVVWANRGGGKTFLGAVATALDMIFKPGIEVRILGGSAEQSRRMHEHLRRMFEHERLERLLDGRSTESRVRLRNGSRAEILAHSERSVRGVRVQKLRCDEVDLFDQALWDAAQLVTRTASPIPGPWGESVRGVVEVLSTMHVPMGMMWGIVKGSGRVRAWTDAAHATGGAGVEPPQRVLFKWGVVDSLERCGSEHACGGCALGEECGGRAKTREVGGHVTISDALVQKRRVSRANWDAEMLCKEPSRGGCVYSEFSPDVHVVGGDGAEFEGTLVAGMDFGVRAPSVVVWGKVLPDGSLLIVDEYAEVGRRLGDHVAAIRARRWGEPAWIGIDPAGAARNEQTGVSNLLAMRSMHLEARAQRLGVGPGIERVRSMLAPASGPVRLRVLSRCTGLIDALCRYHYPAGKLSDLTPEKDGTDHWCDALRYLVVNLEPKGTGRGHV